MARTEADVTYRYRNTQIKRLRKLVSSIVFGAFLGSAFGRLATAQAIWFSPPATLGDTSDYMELFRPTSPWQRAASHVRMFEISGHFTMTAPEADLRQMFSDLSRRHIGLEVGVEPLSNPRPGTPTHCGYDVESYGGPPPLRVAQRAKALGAEPQLFGMDEPLYFGHVFRSEAGRIACHSSIAAIAADVADKLRQVRTVFPGMRSRRRRDP